MLDKYADLFTDSTGIRPFPEYIAKSRALIQQSRVDLAQNAETIIAANAPFELLPNDPAAKNASGKYTRGILLIHGLLDCPLMLHDLGQSLQKQGFLVRAILLPGHGTRPDDLLNVQVDDWMRTVEYGLASLRATAEKIYLSGFSTGAALALKYALTHPDIAALVLLSPAIKIKSPFAFTSNWHTVISWAWKRMQWFCVSDEIDYARYQSITFNAIYQVYRLSLWLKEYSANHQLPCPVFMGLTTDDATISCRAAVDYFTRYANAQSRLVLYTHHHLEQTSPRIVTRPTLYPDLGIREFSHVALPIAPTNPHYGRQGDYPFATRVGNPPVTTTWKPWQKRLTFNPDFAFLSQAIEEFLS